MNAMPPLATGRARRAPGRRRPLHRNPVVLERGLGVLLWTGLILILIAKPF